TKRFAEPRNSTKCRRTLILFAGMDSGFSGEFRVIAVEYAATYKTYKRIKKKIRILANFLHLKLMTASMAGSPNISYRPDRAVSTNGERNLRHLNRSVNLSKSGNLDLDSSLAVFLGGVRYTVKSGKGTTHSQAG